MTTILLAVIALELLYLCIFIAPTPRHGQGHGARWVRRYENWNYNRKYGTD